MNLQILKRRDEILDDVCTGFHPSAVIFQLAETYGVSEKALWSNWIILEEIFQFFRGCKT